MGTLLKVGGAMWALIGLVNLFGMPWGDYSQGIIPFGTGINIVIFVIPGLIAYRMGSGLKKRQAASNKAVPEKKPN